MNKAATIFLIVVQFILLTGCRKEFNLPTVVRKVSIDNSNLSLSKLTITGIQGGSLTKYPLANLIDGNLSTIWSAETTAGYLADPNSRLVTFRLDTSTMQSIAYIKIAFFVGGNKTIKYKFDVQISQDGQTGWVTVLYNQSSLPSSNYALNTDLQIFDFPDTRGKFLRIIGHGNNGPYPKANSYTEVEIYGSVAPIANSIKIPISTDHISTNNYLPPYIAANTIDGKLNTHWTSRMSGTTDYKSVTVNLGKLFVLDQVKISFHTGGDPSSISKFGVYVSSDGLIWNRVISNTFSASNLYGERMESFDFPDITAKYVQVQCYGHTGTYLPSSLNSINEFEVDGIPVSNTCKIESIIQDNGSNAADIRTGYFYYNSLGQLDSVSFKGIYFGTQTSGNLFYQYTYSPDHHLQALGVSWLAVELPRGWSYFFVNYQTSLYDWKNGRIVHERRELVDYEEQILRHDSIVYDPKGRIVAEYFIDSFRITPDPPGYWADAGKDTIYYHYDSRDNLVINSSVAYDNNPSFLQTDSTLMFQFRNYSKSNPLPATAYNSKGLPTGFSSSQYLPLSFFSGRVRSLKYSCPD